MAFVAMSRFLGSELHTLSVVLHTAMTVSTERMIQKLACYEN